MTTTKNNVMVELFDCTLTGRKDDRFGRVVLAKSLNEDDLIDIAVSRRSDLNSSTMKATIEILKEIVIEQIANGASVRFGPGYFNLNVSGVFVGDNAKWDSSQHSLSVQFNSSSELREAIKSTTVAVRGMAASGLVINSVTDKFSGAVNSRLTPGNGAIVTGNKIKLVGNDARVGLQLTNQKTQEITNIPANSILDNYKSKILFIVPTALAPGDYKLRITTQYSNATQILKEPRTYLFDYVLNV